MEEFETVDDLPQIVCPSGVTRRLGWIEPTGTPTLKSYRTSGINRPVMSMKDIFTLASDPNRTSSRSVFGDDWIIKADQGEPGSCNGWAAASSASKCRYKGGLTDGLILSGSYLYSKMNNGVDHGSSISDDIDVLTTYGAPSAEVVTKDMIYPGLQPSNADQLAAQHKGLVMWTIESEMEMYDAAACGYCIIGGLYAGNGYRSFKGPGIMPVFRGKPNHANHVDDIVIVDGKLAFDNANNWGIGWANRGRAYCGFGTYAAAMDIWPFVAIGSMAEGNGQ